MKAYVIDASVAIQWFVPEVYSEAALRLRDYGRKLLAPDLLAIEIANALWKKHRRSEITKQEAESILGAMRILPLRICSSGLVLDAALELACTLDRSIYDSIYLALAIQYKCQMITADRKFYNAIAASLFAQNISWVETPLP